MALVQKSFSEIITFSRASNATRFAPDGTLQYAPHNLLLYSEQFDNAGWAKIRSSITANAIVSPNGTLGADKLISDTTAEQSHYIAQTVAQTGAHTLSIYAKQGEVSGFLLWGIGASSFAAGFNLALGTTYLEAISGVVPPDLGTNIVDVGNGWFRCSISFTANAGTSIRIVLDKDLNGDATYTGDGVSGIFIWGAQLAVGPYPLDYTPTTTAVVYGPRFDYNPTTLAPRGLLIEEQRTNSIRNNTMVGAVAGTPGTVPTNWTVTSTTNGITREVVGAGIEDGISYVDIRFYGTAIASSSFFIATEANTQVVASTGQQWTGSLFMRLISGNYANLSAHSIFLNGYTAAGTFDAAATTITYTYPAGGATNAALRTQRYIVAGTLNSATTTRVNTGFVAAYNASAVIDITLRIGLPQLELGAFPTSVIPTATAAVTRSADIASVNTLSPWYNAAEGTFFSEGSTLKTSGAAPLLIAQVSGGSDRHQVGVYTSTAATVVGGVVQALIGANTSPAIKVAYAYKVNDFAVSNNGGSVATDTSGSVPSGLTYLAIGKFDFGGGESLSGYIRRIAYYNRRLTDAELQVLTS